MSKGLPGRGTPLSPDWTDAAAPSTRSVPPSEALRPDPLLQPQGNSTAARERGDRRRLHGLPKGDDGPCSRYQSPPGAIARAWNASRTIEDWPQQGLIEPPLKTKEGPRWEDFPQQLQADVAAHLKFLATHRRAPDGKRLRPCKATTLRTRRTDLVAFAKKAVRLGGTDEGLSSLSDLLAPEVVDRVLDHEWTQNGDEPKTATIDLAKEALAVARSDRLPDAEQFKDLDDKRATLEQYRKEGMTPKNLKVIRQVLNSEVWGSVVNCPDDLMREARSLKDQAPLKAADDRPDRGRRRHPHRGTGSCRESSVHSTWCQPESNLADPNEPYLLVSSRTMT